MATKTQSKRKAAARSTLAGGFGSSVFLANLHHMCAQTDGSYRFPNSREGDMLKTAKREIEQLRLALCRIARGESEVPMLARQFYGHAMAIATKALSEPNAAYQPPKGEARRLAGDAG